MSGQVSLDRFIEVRRGEAEEVAIGAESVGSEAVENGVERERGVPVIWGDRVRGGKLHVVAELRDPEHRSRCPYCGEYFGAFHGGAMYLYLKGGGMEVLADMDHRR